MFVQRQYPNIWKYSEVVPLPKVRTPTECREFRPISLLINCGKVAENFLTRHHNKHVLPKISNQQCAYCRGLQTTDAVISTLERWISQLYCKTTKAIEVIYKDFSKAFDSLQPSKLLSALSNMQVPGSIIQLCLDFLNGRQQRVRYNAAKSTYIPSRVGVSQGTLFWLAFINSYTPDADITMYADDITCSNPLSTSCDSKLQATIDWGLQWSSSNSMKLNLDKTKAMMMTLHPNCRPPHLTFPLEVVDQFKFLGVYIDKHLSFNPHIEYVTTKAKKRFFSLVQLKKLGVSQDKLSLFYIANIRSVLVYCIAAIFSLLNDTQLNSLERFQKLCTSIILPHIEHYTDRLEILKIPELRTFSKRQYRTHFLKIFNDCDHVLFSCIPERQADGGRRHSSRLKNCFITKARTSKRQRSFFHYGLNNFV